MPLCWRQSNEKICKCTAERKKLKILYFIPLQEFIANVETCNTFFLFYSGVVLDLWWSTIKITASPRLIDYLLKTSRGFLVIKLPERGIEKIFWRDKYYFRRYRSFNMRLRNKTNETKHFKNQLIFWEGGRTKVEFFNGPLYLLLNFRLFEWFQTSIMLREKWSTIYLTCNFCSRVFVKNDQTCP